MHCLCQEMVSVVDADPFSHTLVVHLSDCPFLQEADFYLIICALNNAGADFYLTTPPPLYSVETKFFLTISFFYKLRFNHHSLLQFRSRLLFTRPSVLQCWSRPLFNYLSFLQFKSKLLFNSRFPSTMQKEDFYLIILPSRSRPIFNQPSLLEVDFYLTIPPFYKQTSI